MPYKEEKGWRAKVTRKGRIYTKSFKLKADALRWESQKKRRLRVAERLPEKIPLKQNVEFKIPAANLDELKEKYKLLYKNPENILADIFDSLMEELDLSFRFVDVLNLAKVYCQKKPNRHIPAKIRTLILNRDQFTCQWCGRKAPEVILHVDHVVPKSRGGLTEERNLQTLCRDCNLGKNNINYNIKST